jgi:hypothetical protein
MLMFVDPCIIVQKKKKNPTRCTIVLKFYYSLYLRSLTCFRRHTAHYQEPKTLLAAPFFYSWKVAGSVAGRRCQEEY